MGKGMMIKDFREKVLNEKSKITDKEFFTNVQCISYLQNLIDTITKQFKTPIQLMLEWGQADGSVAYATDRRTLYINVNNEFFNSANSRIDKLVVLKALVLHECGHMLFTDFHLTNNSQIVMQNQGKLFPEPACEEYNNWQTDAVILQQNELLKWVSIYHYVDNAVEDGFIEKMILATVPGEGKCLLPLREMQKGNFQSVKQSRNNGLNTPAIVFNGILQLAKYGTIKMDTDDKDDPALETLLKNYDIIKKATNEQKAFERKRLINSLFCKIYSFLKEEEKREQEKKQNEQNNEENKDDEQKSSGNPNDNSQTDGTNESEEHEEPEENQQDNASDNSQDDSTSSESSNNDNNQNSDESNASDLSNEKAGNDSGNLVDQVLQNAVQDSIRDNLDTGTGSVLNDNNLLPQESDDGIPESNEEMLNSMEENGSLDDTAIPTPSDQRIENSIEESIAAEKVYEEAEQELKEQLEQEAQNMDYGTVNKGVTCVIKRNEPSQKAYSLYEQDMAEIGNLVQKTVREIKNKIKDYQQGGKMNGLYMGRYLDQHSLSRYDCRVLCKNELPEDIPDMAICILIDTSGSMSGEKLSYARKTALLLYEFCLKLDIPVMVYGHSNHHEVELQALADYGSVDGKDRYRICDIYSSGFNRDGMALRFCSDRLNKRREQNKIMFVISDGLPSAYGSQEEGRKDIRNVLIDYSKSNVKYITIGLGEDQKRIEDIYTQDMSRNVAAQFLCTDAPSDLPKAIVQTIKNIIKVK